MSHCQCDGLDRRFGDQYVSQEMAEYRRNGPVHSTRRLIEALKSADIAGMSLLDIGGGVGAIPQALLQAGVAQALDVDASSAYVQTAEAEAARLGQADRMRFLHGDFVALAATIPPADIVTLDRVICCYADMPALVGLSAARATRLYGVVIPRDTWWGRLLGKALYARQVITRSPIRFFVHPLTAIDAIIRAQGLTLRSAQNAGMWRIAVYERH